MSTPDRVTRHHPSLGHDVRADTWRDQGRSNYSMAVEALGEGRVDDAVTLARLKVQEAQEAFDLYHLWLEQLPQLLTDRGVRASTLTPARDLAMRTRDDLAVGWTKHNELVTQFVDRARAVDPASTISRLRGRAGSPHTTPPLTSWRRSSRSHPTSSGRKHRRAVGLAPEALLRRQS